MRFFEITNPISKIVETFYHGSNHGLRPGVYPRSGIVFLSDQKEIAANYGSRVYRCNVDLGKNADLTFSGSSVFREFKISKDLKEKILLGELWKNKPVERKLIDMILKKYDSITLFDTSSEDYDDKDESDFGTTYIVKDASKQVVILEKATKWAERIVRENPEHVGIKKRFHENKRTPNVAKTLASYTDQDGYTVSIVLADDPTGQGRCGIEYISDGKTTVKAGYWMNYPEKEWNISDEQWQRMSLADRAALEVKQQATAYAPLRDQFARWMTQQNKPEDKRPLIAHKWSTGKSLTPSEAAILKTMTRSEIHHKIDQRTKQVRESVIVNEIQSIGQDPAYNSEKGVSNGIRMYDDGDESGFGTTYIVKDAAKQVVVELLRDSIMVDEIQRSGSWNPKITIDNALEHKSELKFLGSYDGVNVFNTVVRNTMYILLQKDKKTIGAAMLQKNHLSNIDGWYMTEIGLRSERGNGHGYGLYRFLLDKGYTIFSGNSQSENGEQVWKNLMNDTHVTVKALRLNMNPDENYSLDPVDINEIDPWADDSFVLMATKNDLYESVMVDEITLSGSKNRDDEEKRNWDKKVNDFAKAAKTNGAAKKLGVIDGINVVLYDATEDDYQIVILSTNKPKENIGYLTLDFRHWGYEIEGWFCEVGLRSDYVGRGIGFKLYQLMISKGFDLVSGYDQTAGSKSIWTKLMNTSGVKVQAIVGDGGDEELVDLKGIDPWKDRTVLLRATRRSVRESVMVDEITTNDWWNMSDADMDTKLNVVDVNSLDYFDDIDSEYSVYTKNDKCYIYDKKAKRLIGYANVRTSFLRGRQHIEVDEIALRPSYRGKNIAYNFYLMLLSLGYIVASGAEQTKGGASIWKRLMNDKRIKVTAFGLGGDIDPADAWHERYARLKAEMISESRMVNEIEHANQTISDKDVKNGIAYVATFPLKIFGVIGDIIVSKSEKNKEVAFLFSRSRKALGYANGHMRSVDIGDEKFEVLEISDIGLYKTEQKKGFGIQFYEMLLSNGYAVISGESQTTLGEKLWRKLIKKSGIGVTAIKRLKSTKYEHVDLVADDAWSGKEQNIQLIIRAGNQEITEGQPRVAVIEPQPKNLSRCTTVSCNAILSHFKAKLITSSAEVPQTAKDCFRILHQRGLKILPDVTSPQKKTPLNIFANTHRNGVWFIGTKGHSMCLIDGELFDAENKGLDSRSVLIAAQIKR